MTIKQRLFRLYTELVTRRAPKVTSALIPLDARPLRIALVTTAEVRRTGDLPFNVDQGDHTFREIPVDTHAGELTIDHTHYDTAPARSDLDCIFPLNTLLALTDMGEIGGPAACNFGFMGYIPDVVPLQRVSIPTLVARLQSTGAEAVLLSPG